MEQSLDKWIALVGAPNTGKSALFNALTGSRQKVANYPGVTVERKVGLIVRHKGKPFHIIDLPGTYSLDAHSPEEAITRDILLRQRKGEPAADIIVAVANASNLERSLGLVLELKSLGLPTVLALNMYDLATARGLQLDLKLLEASLGIAVVPTVAVKETGLTDLLARIEELSDVNTQTSNPAFQIEADKEAVRARFDQIDSILKAVTIREQGPAKWTDRLDSILLHPLLGHFFMALLLLVMFQAVFTWAAPFMEGIEGLIVFLSSGVENLLPVGPLRSLIVDGIFAGVGAVLVFLPQIVFLFLFILILEETGYMARAAFLLDRTMGVMGLHGRAFIPLLSSFACAIPGVMATRTIENRRDRIATILVAPLMTCSARLPIYTLIIGAFIPNTVVAGPLRMQGLVMFGLYLVGVFSALCIAFILRRTLLKGPKPPFVLELPTYKVPRLRNIGRGLWERSLMFVRRAGTLIFAISIVLWFLASYPKPPADYQGSAIGYSMAGRIGQVVEPVVRPLGFSWEIATGLIPGFAAREVMVGALATIYAVEGSEDNPDEVEQALGQRLIGSWSLATAFALLVWYVFSPQCLATFAVIRRETQSWKWTSIAFSYLLALAYIFAFITYQVASGLGLA